MLAYLATKKQFLEDASVIEDKVRDAVKAKLGMNVRESEYLSWRNSLGNAMSNVMHSPEIPNDAGIAIEYRLNGRKFRLDFVISGIDAAGRESTYVVELKQWTDLQFSEMEDYVKTALGGGLQDTQHPSYQAWSYKSHLEQFNEYVYENEVRVKACAYLHNCTNNEVISDSRYERALALAPVFIKGQAADLVEYITDSIKTGPGVDILQRIDEAKVRPSKQLADAVGSMLEGIDEFVLIDEQKTVLEKIMLASSKAQAGGKRVIIVKGGPGTGKSVISIQALSKLTALRQNAKYVSANAAPRDVFSSKLKGILKNDVVKHLFSGSGSFTETNLDTFDALIVDEAHRLRMKSGMYRNLGEDQVKEIIHSAKLSVFFIDEAQKVTWSDVGEVSRIKAAAAEAGAEVELLELVSQFRSTGSDDYMAWLDNALEVQIQDQSYFSADRFDFRVVDSPSELHNLIREKNRENNKSRVVAGYNWNWVSQKNPKAMDIVIGTYEAQWNLKSYGNDWIKHPKSIDEVGCIHTCQGLEVEYIGVIIGDDLIYRDGRLVTNPDARARTDQSLKGYKKELSSNPEGATIKVDELIRNTYRTLMTRGMKGCYVFCTDKRTSDYFKSLLPIAQG